FMTEILKFFIQLINMLLQLLGGGKINMPSSSEPVPSIMPSTVVPENPSQAMEQPEEEQPSVSMAPCPSSGTPSEIPNTNPSNAAPVPSVSEPVVSGPAVSPNPSGGQSSIDLTTWELTLPTGTSGNPTDVFMPQLASFTADP